MKLLIISFSKIISDARVLKQIELFQSEYEVITCGYGPEPTGVSKHFSIPDEHVYWRRNKAFTILRLYERAYWSSPAVAWAKKALENETFDCVLADDIDSVGLALSLDSRFGVHADLHEYSPREKEDVWQWRMFIAPYMRWQVRRYVTKAKSTTTVGNYIAEEYKRNFGISPGVVTNATPYADLAPTELKNPIALVHSGAARDDRFLELMIEAVRRFPGRFTFDLYLTPNNPEYLESLKKQVEQDSHITVHDGVPYNELIATLNRFDVGIHMLPPVNFNNKWALPNKFFDFVQARLALVIGPSPEMAGLVQQYNLGEVSTDFTVDSLANALAKLDAEKVSTYKMNSHTAASELSAESTVAGWGAAIRTLHQ